MSNEDIGKFFDREAEGWGRRHDDKGIPSSAKNQVEEVLRAGVNSVIDVGCGPATILLEMIEGGVERGIGIDLSKKMCEQAEQRVVEKGVNDRVVIRHGSFLDLPTEKAEAVSMHRVLCCHPDREGMLDKAVECEPEIITLTVPGAFLPLRLLINGLSWVKEKLVGGFRPYIHKHSEIIGQLEERGYALRSSKGVMWRTLTFERSSPTRN